MGTDKGVELPFEQVRLRRISIGQLPATRKASQINTSFYF